jgi:hypothetical protein
MKKTPTTHLRRETLTRLELASVAGADGLVYTVTPELCANGNLKPERVQ